MLFFSLVSTVISSYCIGSEADCTSIKPTPPPTWTKTYPTFSAFESDPPTTVSNNNEVYAVYKPLDGASSVLDAEKNSLDASNTIYEKFVLHFVTAATATTRYPVTIKNAYGVNIYTINTTDKLNQLQIFINEKTWFKANYQSKDASGSGTAVSSTGVTFYLRTTLVMNNFYNDTTEKATKYENFTGESSPSITVYSLADCYLDTSLVNFGQISTGAYLTNLNADGSWYIYVYIPDLMKTYDNYFKIPENNPFVPQYYEKGKPTEIPSVKERFVPTKTIIFSLTLTASKEGDVETGTVMAMYNPELVQIRELYSVTPYVPKTPAPTASKALRKGIHPGIEVGIFVIVLFVFGLIFTSCRRGKAVRRKVMKANRNNNPNKGRNGLDNEEDSMDDFAQRRKQTRKTTNKPPPKGQPPRNRGKTVARPVANSGNPPPRSGSPPPRPGSPPPRPGSPPQQGGKPLTRPPSKTVAQNKAAPKANSGRAAGKRAPTVSRPKAANSGNAGNAKSGKSRKPTQSHHRH